MIWLLPHPSPVSNIDRGDRKTEKERQLTDGRGEEVSRVKSYDGKKAWSSINIQYSLLMQTIIYASRFPLTT
jgi:hypothetical protein